VTAADLEAAEAEHLVEVRQAQVDRQEEPEAEPDVELATPSSDLLEDHAEPEPVDEKAVPEVEGAPEDKATAESDAADQRKVEAEPQAEEAPPAEVVAEPEPERLGPDWGYDAWAEPTQERDDDRRSGRGMGMEM
jgi:hypothetical protein